MPLARFSTFFFLVTLLGIPALAEEPKTGETSLQTEVEAAENSFNQAARERDREAFQALLAEDTVFLAGELHQGRLGVLAIWQHLFDGKFDFRYEAELLEAHAAGSGEFAWAIGEVETSFQRPGLDTAETTAGHYLHVLERDDEGTWRITHNASLVVHPTLGAARDPRSGLMTAWPELADLVDAQIDVAWRPTTTVRAESGEMAYTFGEYEATFTPTVPADEKTSPETEPEAIGGKGHYLAIWQKDDAGHWQLAAEGFTPPGIYRDE